MNLHLLKAGKRYIVDFQLSLLCTSLHKNFLMNSHVRPVYKSSFRLFGELILKTSHYAANHKQTLLKRVTDVGLILCLTVSQTKQHYGPLEQLFTYRL
jgi:hypothetical protein